MGIAHVIFEVNDKFTIDKTRLLILNDTLPVRGTTQNPFWAPINRTNLNLYKKFFYHGPVLFMRS